MGGIFDFKGRRDCIETEKVLLGGGGGGCSDLCVDCVSEATSVGATKRVLISGAAGGVGMYLVQLAALIPDVHVVAATSSNSRNEAFLKDLGADDMVEYTHLPEKGNYDIIIDTVGGEVLAGCWATVSEKGTLVSVDSSSFNFVSEHTSLADTYCTSWKKFADMGLLRPFVAATYPLAEAEKAYEHANGRFTEHGKVVLTV
ncbi:hypothetical protein VTN00DRAFT_858 [Thermoascus crustaceus]|uniref:uncharacterized protein n=1 Tax=Thermoascus crustaceus TaxID=5088 RepID=UPI0037445A53